MFLLVGLGNPGDSYVRNRHNVGFMAVDRIAADHGLSPFRGKFQGALAEGVFAGDKVLALKPQTYMNESGRSVSETAHFYKIPPEQIIVIHDEIDLAPGKVRAKFGGGAAGHNGIRSIAAHQSPDFWRVRIGVDHPGGREQVSNHVLDDFSKTDMKWLEPVLAAISDALPLLFKGKSDEFMTRVALLTTPEKAKPNKPETE